MVAWPLLAYSTFRTVGKTAVFLSQWCTLQGFVQSTMWHSTEPRTLGVSYWATGLLIGATCLPGLLYLLASVVFPAPNCQSHGASTGYQFSSFIVRIIPSLTLLCAALPYLDDMASARTWLLGVGVIFSHVYIILLSWTLREIPSENSFETTRTRINPTICVIYYERARKAFSKALSSTNIGGDGLIAVCVGMGVRWQFFGVNVFYENWRAPLTLTLIIFIYAAILLMWRQSSVKKSRILFSPLAKRKLSKSDKNLEESDRGNQSLPETTREHGIGKKNGNNEPILSAKEPELDEINADGGAQPENTNIHCQISTENGLISLRPSKEENIIFTPTIESTINAQRSCVNASHLCVFLYAFTLALALGALANTYLWIFTSTSILRLWGQTADNPSSYLIMTCFAVGCLLAILTNLEKICPSKYSDPNANEIKISQEKRLVMWQRIANAVLIVAIAVGTSLILLTNEIPCLIGSAILCLASPLLLRSLLVMSYDLVMTSMSLRPPGSRKAINMLPGTLLFLSGFTFVIFHLLGVSFINPQLTTIVHGKMGALLVPQIILEIMPLICGPLVKNKIKVCVHLRSSSTGPLLDSESTTLQRQERPGVKDSNKATPPYELWRLRKYRKIVQIFLVLIIVLTSVICKHNSQVHKRKCDAEIASDINCDTFNGTLKPDVRVMSWNILLGHKMNGRTNLEAIARITDEYDPHVLALQEATGHPPYWGGKDIFGYLQSNTKSCRKVGKSLDPRIGSLEVGMLSRFNILSQSFAVLPNAGITTLPKYTMAKITCEASPTCNFVGELGFGMSENPPQIGYTLHIYTIHAVYKNWTCDRYSRLSCEQMQFIHDDIRKLPEDDPVIVMGDFNINPSEPELDIWFQSDIGFKSAMWRHSWNSSRHIFNHTCGETPKWDDETCDCECRNNSSDPPETTILNRKAAIDHIFYRGLKLDTAKILDEVGEVSDHYPILADFKFE